MKIVKVKPFGVFKVTENVLETVEKHTSKESNPQKSIQEVIKSMKRNGSSHCIGIFPEEKEWFSFIPIIENDQFFASKFPDPIQLYYSLAFSNYQYAEKTRKNITFQKGQGSTPFNFVNSYLYNWHLQHKISTIIFLHSTVEAFINYQMPEEFIFRQEYESEKSDKFLKQIKEFNKEQTERYIQFKEKLAYVIPQLTKIDFQKSHKNIYDRLLNLNSLRNDIIHLRSTKEKNQQHFHKVFDEVLNVNLTPFVESVKDFVNTVKPNFIEFEDIDPTENETSVFNLVSYEAFKLDIEIFLKILEVPTKKVILNIPKSEKKPFQTVMNWVMQNLDIMAKKQLILFPTISTEQADKIVIEITKTDKKLGEKTSSAQ